MTDSDGAEVLERDPEHWRPGRKAQIVTAIVLALGFVAALADREARADEAAALTECSAAIDAAIAASLAPMDSMIAYVRVTRDGAPAKLSRELDAMVAGQTANASAHLEPAVTHCARIHVLSHHADLRERKRNCLARLDVATKYFAEVARDGSVAFQSRSLDRDSARC